jgi:hypothetical protein
MKTEWQIYCEEHKYRAKFKIWWEGVKFGLGWLLVIVTFPFRRSINAIFRFLNIYQE